MSETARIADQLQRAFAGNAWHGPSLRELLADVSAERAAARPLPNTHNIWELVLHITAWTNVARRRALGDNADLSPQENFPNADKGETAWKEALASLERAHRELLAAIASLPDSRLQEEVPGHGYTVYVLLHGVVQHALYHAGQIALLRKEDGTSS
ncbi:MAG: DinB family protein [Terriglobales bacterium]